MRHFRAMWRPTTEADLEIAAAAGVLDEYTSRIEFKQEITATDSGRRRFAEELASLAVDGGLLIVGVVDPKHRTNPTNPASALRPVPLQGEPERIEQIAAVRCDPPLFVRTLPIPTAADPSKGFLVVDVPPSPVAPHMVDGRYMGRGDTAKRHLNDADVIRLHERRRTLDEDVSNALNAFIRRDPLIAAGRPQHRGHLFIVAEPRGGRPDMFYDVATHTHGWQEWLLHFVHRRANDDPRFHAQFAPDLDTATRVERRPDGWALTSHYYIDTDADALDEERLLEVELTADGAVRLFCGRGTYFAGNTPVIIEELVAGLAYRAVCVAADVASACGYLGEWALGAAATRIEGARSGALNRQFSSQGRPYPDRDYHRVTRSASAELQDDPTAVVGRLVGRLIRVFETEGHAGLKPYMRL
jgi:hypothetical protein